MSLPIVLPDVDSMRVFMRGLDATTRTRGESYFNQGLVSDVQAENLSEGCILFSAKV